MKILKTAKKEKNSTPFNFKKEVKLLPGYIIFVITGIAGKLMRKTGK